MRRHTIRHLGAGLLAPLVLLLMLPGVTRSASATDGALTVRTATAFGLEKSKTVTRIHVNDGKQNVADKRTVSMSVDVTSGLRDRQAIRVSWSGAHPTGGLVADQNSGDAAYRQEYPMVLMQCRGVDSGSVAPGQRVRPETCWTQTPYERFNNSYGESLPPWRLDQFAAKSDRERYVDAPRDRPADCFGKADVERWVAFEAPGGKTYRGGPNGCAGTAPEATQVGSLNLPSNTTYAATSAGGRGSAVFNVRASTSNASLGCSQKVACSLVAIPIMGIGCDVDAKGLPGKGASNPDDVKAAAEKCTAKGKYAAGENAQPSVQADGAVTGSLWWSASNWRNRISFPLHFAPGAAACDITSTGGQSIFGSELMTQAFDQWSPVFCLDEQRTPIKQVQTGEPQARNLYSIGEIDAALVSRIPDSTPVGRPTVKAPVGATGFAITFTVDDENGRPIQQLHLTPRLIAKLMTLSYPAINAVKLSYPALSNNPINLAADPEFQALNPTVPDNLGTQSAATLLNLSSDSDVIWALTSYINADPEARAWLDGKPDPWGMKVNPNYRGIALPTETWTSLDDFKPESIYRPGVNDCLYQNPVPYLPLVAAPLTRLSYIALAMQFSIAQSQVVCSLPSFIPGSTEGAKMIALGRQTPGFRFMLGVTSIADAERYEVSEASLQTYVESSARQGETELRGRTFVAPTPSSLRAAVTQLEPDPDAGVWTYDYRKVLSTKSAADAYPGMMLVYAALPTDGLEKSVAGAYADWLRYVVTKGQNPGVDLGELPPGYVPITAANGMAGLRDYALRAADAVAAQKGEVPLLEDTDTPDGENDPNDPPGSNDIPPGSGPTSQDFPGPEGSDAPPGGENPDGEPTPQALEPLGETVGTAGGLIGLAVPLVLGLALLTGAVAGAVIVRDRIQTGRSR